MLDCGRKSASVIPRSSWNHHPFIILDLIVERGSGFRKDISGCREQNPLHQSSLGMLFLKHTILSTLKVLRPCFEMPTPISAASLREESTFFCSTSTGSAGAWPAFIPSTLSMTSPFTLFKTVVLGILNVSQVFQYDMMSIFYRINSLVQVLNIFFLFLQKPLSSI